MPAKVTVQSGVSAGTSHWIEQAVVRIGSDPRADVCLPSADVPSHALTLEYREGVYRVYNRCRANIFIGTRVVEPSKSLPWPDTDILQLNDEIELVLDLDDDPSPVPMRTAPEPDWDEQALQQPGEATAMDVAHGDERADAASADGSKFMLQMAVIVLCLLGCIVLLARESLKDADGQRRQPPSFAAVIRNAIASETSPELIQRLQYAESAAIRGNHHSARARFGALRDDLVPQQELFVATRRQPELAILDFVEYRLGTSQSHLP